MKSFIDWNEVFDELPKALRETLMLEAVQILSQRKRGPGSRAPRTVAKGAAPAVVLPNSLRAWSRDGRPEGAGNTGAALPDHHDKAGR